jgi:hypothetical protein
VRDTLSLRWSQLTPLAREPTSNRRLNPAGFSCDARFRRFNLRAINIVMESARAERDCEVVQHGPGFWVHGPGRRGKRRV